MSKFATAIKEIYLINLNVGQRDTLTFWVTDRFKQKFWSVTRGRLNSRGEAS